MRKSRFASRPASVSCLTMRATSPGAAPTIGSHAARETSSARRRAAWPARAARRAERRRATRRGSRPAARASARLARRRVCCSRSRSSRSMTPRSPRRGPRRARAALSTGTRAGTARARLRAARPRRGRGVRTAAGPFDVAAAATRHDGPPRARCSSRAARADAQPPTRAMVTAGRRPRDVPTARRRVARGVRDSAAAGVLSGASPKASVVLRAVRRTVGIPPEFGSARAWSPREQRTWMVTPSCGLGCEIDLVDGLEHGDGSICASTLRVREPSDGVGRHARSEACGIAPGRAPLSRIAVVAGGASSAAGGGPRGPAQGFSPRTGGTTAPGPKMLMNHVHPLGVQRRGVAPRQRSSAEQAYDEGVVLDPLRLRPGRHQSCTCRGSTRHRRQDRHLRVRQRDG